MNRLILGLTGGFLVLTALFAGCATKTTPAPAATTQNITGVLNDLNTPADPGKDVVTIQTPQGDKTFTLTPDTTFELEGKTCLLDDVGRVLETGNATYQCNIYYDAQLNAVNLTVWRSVDPLKNPN